MSQTAQKFQLWQRFRRRTIIMTVFIGIGFASLLLRLVQLQAIEGEVYLEKSQRVIRKVAPLIAPRGELFDRNYESRENAVYLTSNSSTLNLIAIPSHFSRGELITSTRLLERALALPANSLVSRVTEAKIRSNEEIILIENLNPQQHSILADYYLNFSRFIVRQSTQRNYPFGPAAAHVTGYIGPPSRSDIDNGIRSYQLVGKNGLEAFYDSILRGEDGEIVQIRTAVGEVEEQKVFRNFIPGNNLVLTIDGDMQNVAYKALGDKTGAIVALMPATGEIIALVSKPEFDPNILTGLDRELRSQHIVEIQQNKAELNRAISTKYPPASTFKTLVALAALEERRFDPGNSFKCPGKFVLKSSYRGLPDTVFNDWAVHGTNDLISAIAKSCSVYFYELGYKIGAEPIIKYSRYFHLDDKSEIDLPAEINGFVPSPAWKEKAHDLRWFDGDTVNLSIGQGFIETTLIGMVNMYAGIANDGVVYRPHLVRQIRYADNDEIKESIRPEPLFELPIARTTLETVKTGLREVVVRGTARGVLGYPGMMPIAGKTGTVQTRSNDRFANSTQHAWFIGYGPFDGPRDQMLLIGVFVERGIGGSVGAAPVARDMFIKWAQKLAQQKRGST
ncbi:MAG: penicillin-binding protein 2 [Leptospiraceae bacterium]|nr:penicillin-binding protein 2 [Leptospiraceae bacterium]MCB1199828.1 penicillin-binding protein 2 [Leptospiraceae bacterium]